MAEYIEREGAIKAIDHEVSLDGLYANIEAIPAADVVPVVHGSWVFGEFNGIGSPVKCSVCGFCKKNVDPKLWIEYPAHKFCGVCGAKMDGE